MFYGKEGHHFSSGEVMRYKISNKVVENATIAHNILCFIDLKVKSLCHVLT